MAFSRHKYGFLTYVQEENDEEYQARVMAALEKEDEDKIIEERRRRREEILAKFGRALEHAKDGDMETVEAEDGETLAEDAQGPMDIWKHDQPEADDNKDTIDELQASGIGERLDEEGQRRIDSVAQVHHDYKNGAAESGPGGDEDDLDDIFADTPDATKNIGTLNQPEGPGKKGLVDSYDDAEGYYNFQVGEVLAKRYEVFATHGRGVFSSVLRARDLKYLKEGISKSDLPEVAVKVIRANETMYKAGQTERVILNKLSQSDPEGRKHCVRLVDSFEYRNHLCLVFEPMDMDLRSLTKRYGRGIGLSIHAVRVYAMQMFVALQHLRNSGVLHADIKPDNILVNSKRTVVKVCDFGSAMFSGDNEITPYLVSRFYRSPEVILGLPYNHPMDMWSIGCVIYELFTGKILFPGKTNNEMLKLMMDLKGPFPKKMIKKAEFAFKHFEFDQNMSFALLEEDPVTKQPVRRIISNPQKTQDFAARLLPLAHATDRKKVTQLVDLLDRMMVLDPDRRITPLEALKHPFIKEQMQIHSAPRSLTQGNKNVASRRVH